MTQPVAGVSNMILYTVQFSDTLDDGVVERVAQREVERPDADLTTEDIYAGIVAALASDETLTGFIRGHRHSEQEYRDFLARVLRQLDEMRPWPKPPFQPVNPRSWKDLDSAKPAARIKLDTFDVGERLHEIFRSTDDGRRAMGLRLNSGTEVAIVAEWWPGSEDTALVLRHSHQDVAGVLEEFCTATGIGRDEIEVVSRA